ncbi:peptidase C39 family protein [Microbacterium kyungheense]|uniref:Peptidase C39-like protein n=1 Tax=Microbacterium kyungheense TaxID=1263636 RepID=A0A543EUB7_9MICO|nr:peptidase C39-like protein [Microbacterium kyungheense]
MHPDPPVAPPPARPEWHTHLVRADTAAGWDGRRWTSAALSPVFAADAPPDEVVPSWNLEPGAGADVEIRARSVVAGWHPWQDMAHWGAPGDRRSSPAHAPSDAPDDLLPVVDTDILRAAPRDRWDAVQLRVTLHEPSPASARPLRLAAVSFTAPRASAGRGPAVAAVPHALAVPPLSQRAYPARDDLGGGGPAWCSPTSLTMVASAWGMALPAAAAADAPHGADPRVPGVARAVYDSSYDGTGNWAFNTAAAGEWGLDAVVTRLASLNEASTLTQSGIPLIASVSFRDGELPGADYATAGHLLVIRGFDARGDVLVADPANPGGAAGLRTYPRDPFDTAWSHSRRTVYLVTPRGRALPPAAGEAAW